MYHTSKLALRFDESNFRFVEPDRPRVSALLPGDIPKVPVASQLHIFTRGGDLRDSWQRWIFRVMGIKSAQLCYVMISESAVKIPVENYGCRWASFGGSYADVWKLDDVEEVTALVEILSVKGFDLESLKLGCRDLRGPQGTYDVSEVTNFVVSKGQASAVFMFKSVKGSLNESN
jgi:hypothetical protein